MQYHLIPHPGNYVKGSTECLKFSEAKNATGNKRTRPPLFVLQVRTLPAVGKNYIRAGVYYFKAATAKTALLLIFLFSGSAIFSQTPTDTTRTEEYCMILGTQKFLSNKITIEIDFGQQRSVWKDNRERDEATGKAVTFNSAVDALNYMNGRGWVFVDANIVTYSNSNIYNYLMKRTIPASGQ